MKVVVFLAALFLLEGCAGSATRQGFGSASGFNTVVADRLYFGRAIPGGGNVTEAKWRDFMREKVTPNFPNGLTVWRAEGQWLEISGRLIHEPVMVVEVVHRPGVPPDSAFESLATEYRKRFRQEAVLRVTTPARMRLYQ
jgi:hypothetical protein